MNSFRFIHIAHSPMLSAVPSPVVFPATEATFGNRNVGRATLLRKSSLLPSAVVLLAIAFANFGRSAHLAYRRSAMKLWMLLVRCNHKIINPIVIFLAVKMVNDFLSKHQITTKLFLHYKDMLSHVIPLRCPWVTGRRKEHVTPLVDVPAPLPSPLSFWVPAKPLVKALAAAHGILLGNWRSTNRTNSGRPSIFHNQYTTP